MFDITATDPNSRARTGRLTTPHGIVETPSYVIVATDAAIRTLNPEDIPRTKTQMVIANTYHLWRSLGEEGLSTYPGLHEAMEWKGAIMTDSGGFQVFSMGAAREHGVNKVGSPSTPASVAGLRSGDTKVSEGEEGNDPSLVRVTDSGVYFREKRSPSTSLGALSGANAPESEEIYLDAEYSMKIQEQLGADIIFAFDEPSSPLHDHTYTKKAMERTHAWALRSLDAVASDQMLYGIVQGGAFEDLRRESAQFIGKLPFAGFAIGGSFGSSFGSEKSSTARELSWTIPYLPEGKPRHLLGMGKIDDLFEGVEQGIDTFDCVIPTREARHGRLWTSEGHVDIQKGKYAADDSPIGMNCECPVCVEEGVTRRDLRALFKERNPEAGRLATMHNIWFFNDLMEKIREAIPRGELAKLRERYAAFGKDKE